MASQWIRREPGTYYIFRGGREVAFVLARPWNKPAPWFWSVPQAGEYGEVRTMVLAKAAAEAAIKRYTGE